MGKHDNDAEAGCSVSSSTKSTKSDINEKLEIKEKLRVLCLHGYRQNGDTFRSKLGSFRKHVAKYAELVFITAPHIAAPMPGLEEVPDEQRSWWFNKEDYTFKGTNKNGPAFGFEESLRHVETVWEEEGPFQGLLGFSQGACFVGLLCGLAERKLTSVRPEFALIAAGFESGSLTHKSVYEDMISIPTMHIFGNSDEIIPMELSKDLSYHFSNADMLEHTGGHYFPATSANKHRFADFFRERLVEHLERKELQSAQNIVLLENEELAKSDSSVET